MSLQVQRTFATPVPWAPRRTPLDRDAALTHERLRIDRGAVDVHLKVHVAPERVASLAFGANRLPCADLLARANEDLAHVAVAGGNAAAMLDAHEVLCVIAISEGRGNE